MSLGDILVKLGRGEILGPTELEEARLLANMIQSLSSKTAGIVSGLDRIEALSVGELTVSNNGVDLILLDDDGDALFGPNIAAPATTSLAIFSNAQTYNSESMGAGDVLFGDNSANKANLLWDASDGKILFRGGTTTQGYVDTTGAAVFGAGAVGLDDDGVTFTSGTDDFNKIKWKQALGAAFSGAQIYAIVAPNPTDLTTSMGIQTYATGAEDSSIQLIAWGSSPYAGKVSISLQSGSRVVVNNDGLSVDFCVQGNTDAYLLQVDASADMVGIGDAAPGEKLDVAGNINATGVLKIDDVQVVGPQVVDARADDVANSGDATTDGLIDALRDAMIAHGLIAAA